MSQRRALFKATCELLRLLSRAVHRGEDSLNLTSQLFRRLATAAMLCPGFTPLMKDDIAYLSHTNERDQMHHGQPRFAERWRHQYALAPKADAPVDVIDVSHQCSPIYMSTSY